MSRRNQIGYIHKSGTGNHSNKRRCSVISAIPGHHPSDRNRLVDTTLPPSTPPDTSDVMAATNKDHQPVSHMYSESSIRTVLNANYVHSTSILISMTYTNSNGDGVLSKSSARLPATSNYPLNTELNSDSCYTSLSANKNKSTGVESSASIPVLDARNKS